MAGKEDCESLFTHLKNRKLLAEKYLVRRFLSIQQLIEDGDLDNVYWLPGVENPADGLTKLKSEMRLFLPLLETCRFNPAFYDFQRGFPRLNRVCNFFSFASA